MAFSSLYYNEQASGQYRNFLCDTRDDTELLPTQSNPSEHYKKGVRPGAKAIVIEDGSVWVLNNSDVWAELGGGD